MTPQSGSYPRHRFPAEIIAHAVWLHHVFSLNLRDVDIAYETYFNGDTNQGGHALCPNSSYPRSTAVYQKDWSLGQ